MVSVTKALQGNPYPGRGVLLGRSQDGRCAVSAYFIMGRSVNSRNRVFVAQGDGLRTQAHDPALLTDPSLVIYAPVRVLGSQMIVTNGDQTDTVYAYMERGARFEDALRTRTFEPDPPILTPRISGLLDLRTGAHTLSILKSAAQNEARVVRQFFEYTEVAAGEAHLIHTYRTDGDPVPSFAGEPVCIGLAEKNAQALADTIWDALDAGNRVSLFVRYTDCETGETDTHIINRHAE